MGHIHTVYETSTIDKQQQHSKLMRKNKNYEVKRLVSSIYDWTQSNSDTFKWKEMFGTTFKIHSSRTEFEAFGHFEPSKWAALGFGSLRCCKMWYMHWEVGFYKYWCWHWGSFQITHLPSPFHLQWKNSCFPSFGIKERKKERKKKEKNHLHQRNLLTKLKVQTRKNHSKSS